MPTEPKEPAYRNGRVDEGFFSFGFTLIVALVAISALGLGTARNESVRRDVVFCADVAAEDACDPANRPQRVHNECRTRQ